MVRQRAGRTSSGWRSRRRAPSGPIRYFRSEVSAPFDDDPVYLTELPDDLRARRAEAARRRRWRRRLAALAVLAVLGAVAAIALTSLGGDDGASKASGTNAANAGGGSGSGSATTGGSTTTYPADWK